MKKRRRSVLVAQKKKLARMGFKGKGVNLSRIDPTRTVTLRRDFATQIKRAFGKLKLALVKLMIDEDAFGLKKKEVFTFNTFDEDLHPRDADGKFASGGVDVSKLSKIGYKEIGTGKTKNGKHITFIQGPIEKDIDDTFVVLIGGKEIGRAVVSRSKIPHITRIEIDEEHRRQGIGTQLYDTIEKSTGQKLVPSPLARTPAADALWRSRKPTNNTFDEDAHPRDSDGKFSSGDGGIEFAPGDLKSETNKSIYIHDTAPGLKRANFVHDKTQFSVDMIKVLGSKNWSIVFGIGDEASVFLDMSKTGKHANSAIGVFRKVGKVIDQFIEKESPQQFYFTAEKIVPSRVKLYNKLSQVLAQRHGYKLTHEDTNVERRYIFDKENTPTKNILYIDFYTDFDLAFNADWQFKSDPEQIKAFQEWLKSQFKSFITSQTQEQLWDLYIEQGFRKGAGRSFDDVTASEKEFGPSLRGDGLPGSSKMDFYKGSKAQFLQDSFAQPVSRDRLKILAGRSFDELEGVTGDMSTKISRHLTDGLVQGMSPREIARKMADEVDIGRTRALTIARTEIIRAHAEGQLTSLENLGVEEVGVSVEWSTTGDEKVCDLCEPLEGIVLKIEEARGMLPRHPNCRCAWIPAGVGEDGDNQKGTKRSITKAIGLSQKRGNDEDDEEGWGPGASISKSRPQSILNSRITPALLAFSGSILNTFNPDQPRDESGKWTSSGAAPAKPAPSTIVTPSQAVPITGTHIPAGTTKNPFQPYTLNGIKHGTDITEVLSGGNPIELKTSPEAYNTTKLDAWYHALNESEKVAIRSWTDSGSNSIRKGFYTGNPSPTEKALVQALEKGESFDGNKALLWRGIRGDYANQLISNLKAAGVGGTYNDPALHCMSMDPERAVAFSENNLLLQIRTKTGKVLDHHSEYASEREVVGMPRVNYRVVGMHENVDIHLGASSKSNVKMVVYLEEI